MSDQLFNDIWKCQNSSLAAQFVKIYVVERGTHILCVNASLVSTNYTILHFQDCILNVICTGCIRIECFWALIWINEIAKLGGVYCLITDVKLLLSKQGICNNGPVRKFLYGGEALNHIGTIKCFVWIFGRLFM